MKYQHPSTTHRNCSDIKEYYDIHSSLTGSVYNCRQKQFRQQHHCEVCGVSGFCEYKFTFPDDTFETGYYGEDYFLINENLEIQGLHYMQLNEARTRFPLVCLHNFTSPYDGQIGLADNNSDRFRGKNFVDDLYYKKQNLTQNFDICIHPYDGEFPDQAGYIAFGTESIQHFMDFRLSYYSNLDGLYYIDFKFLSVDKRITEEIKNLTGVMATGEPYLMGPQWIIEKIENDVKYHCDVGTCLGKLYKNSNQILCIQKNEGVSEEEMNKSLPDITLIFDKDIMSRNITWKSDHYLIPVSGENDKYCFALKIKELHKRVNKNNLLYIGSKVLEGFKVQFDRHSKYIYFQKDRCLFNKTAHKFVFNTKSIGAADWQALVYFFGFLVAVLAGIVIYKVVKLCIEHRKEKKREPKFKKFYSEKKEAY